MSRKGDSEHPVLPQAWKYEVVEFHWARADDGERFVDLVLRHAETGVERKLRFRKPEDVRFSDCGMSWGLFIDDISARQLQGLHVRVGNFENDATQVELMAGDVADITSE